MFDRNATGTLAPFNGMMVVGTHEEQLNAEGTSTTTITLWEWESRNGNFGIIPLQEESPMNTTTMSTSEPRPPTSMP